MPPPRPLKLQHSNHVRTYSSDYEIHSGQALTPRTPHRSAMGSHGGAGTSSNSLRAPAGSSAVIYDVDEHELEELGHRHRDEETRTYQTEPLLASSTDASFPHRKLRRSASDSSFTSKLKGKGKVLNAYVHLPSRHTLSRLLEHAPLVLGSSVALLLFFMIIVSLNRPDALLRAIGVSPNVTEQDSAAASVPIDTMPSDGPKTHSESKHIISYANYTTFPLTPLQFLTECYKIHSSMGKMVGGYWDVSPEGGMDVMHPNVPQKSGGKSICSSSITYMLDGYVGLSADLALMAQAAAFALERNRTFFVNDRYWNRGKWADHFLDVREMQPGPEPGCLPPPPEELVACPRTAKHWVLSSRTAKFHLSHGYEDQYEDAYARSLRRLKPIFINSERSLKRTILPNAISRDLISAARVEVVSLSELNWDEDSQTDPEWDGDRESKNTAYIGVHVRRGDRKAESWPNIGKYVPLEQYGWAVEKTWKRIMGGDDSGAATDSKNVSPAVVWLATDTPDVVDDFTDIMFSMARRKKGDEPRIFSLSTSFNPRLRAIASSQAYVQDEFAGRPEEDRVRETRGAIVDLAMVSGLWQDLEGGGASTPAAVVCTLSSNVCKIAAFGFGWDRAFGFGPRDADATSQGSAAADEQNTVDDSRKRWVEIDDKGNIEPVWRAFELF